MHFYTSDLHLSILISRNTSLVRPTAGQKINIKRPTLSLRLGIRMNWMPKIVNSPSSCQENICVQIIVVVIGTQLHSRHIMLSIIITWHAYYVK